MSFVDKFKEWFVENDDSDNENDTENENEEYENSHKSKPRKKSYEPPIPDDYDEPVEEEPPVPTPPPPSVSSSKPPRPERENSSRTPNTNNIGRIKVDAVLEVVLVKPEVYTDAKQVADHLMNGKTVVINLENTTPETKRRILDFLTGVAYANKGAIKSVATLTYIITPHNVGFTGDDIVSELENNGVTI